MTCVDESVSNTEVILLRLEESEAEIEAEIEAGGGGSGLFKSESGDLGSGKIELTVDTRDACRMVAAVGGCTCIIGFPWRGLGAGGGFERVRFAPSCASPNVMARLATPISASSSSWEVRGLSAAIGGMGSKIDCREIEAESAVLLLSLSAFGGPVLVTFVELELFCVFPPVSSSRAKASRSIVGRFDSSFDASAALWVAAILPSLDLLANLLNVFWTASSGLSSASTEGSLVEAMFSLVFFKASDTTPSSSSPELSKAPRESFACA